VKNISRLPFERVVDTGSARATRRVSIGASRIGFPTRQNGEQGHDGAHGERGRQ